jgi:hypothetical protein
MFRWRSFALLEFWTLRDNIGFVYFITVAMVKLLRNFGLYINDCVFTALDILIIFDG